MPRTAKPAKGKRPAALTAVQIDAVLRASRALVGVAASSIAELGEVVTIPQFRVLVMIDTLGPLNLVSVADGLDVNPSNASRICDRLIRAGLLNRGEAAVDRRNISLSLTRDGRQLVRKVTGHRRRAIGRVLSVMTPAERDAVVAALDVFAAAAGEPQTDTPLDAMWPPA
ncbi:MAG: MarR family transcriptional regulator [Mycobacterium sp.]|nr:MarR family transcriptional regulator [Mycobacterium sp.]